MHPLYDARTRLSDVPADFFLLLHCACSTDGPRVLRVGYLATRRGPHALLGDVLDKTYCVRCKARPTRAELSDQPVSRRVNEHYPEALVRTPVAGWPRRGDAER